LTSGILLFSVCKGNLNSVEKYFHENRYHKKSGNYKPLWHTKKNRTSDENYKLSTFFYIYEFQISIQFHPKNDR
jgi:hypothetical protein